MANFSKKALGKVGSVVQSLDAYLGPGTAELSMRFGLHSGPVMAGVLRGQKSRFQLFGDTMNTASRIEATGIKNKIHLSQQTADLIVQAGKHDWVVPRDNLVSAKGKGQLQTFWLVTSSRKSISLHKPASMSALHMPTPPVRRLSIPPSDGSAEGSTVSPPPPPSLSDPQGCRLERLINFNTQVLQRLLKQIIAMREVGDSPVESNSSSLQTVSPLGDIVEGVQEAIAFPSEPTKFLRDPNLIELTPNVKKQLRHYVTKIASMYDDVPFHGFDHAR